MSRWSRTITVLALALLAALLLVGCERGGPAAPADAAADAAPKEQTFEDGLLRVTVRYDRTRMTTAQRLKLELVTALDDSFELEPIDLETSFGADWIVSAAASSGLDSTEEDGRTVRRHRFTLEPYMPGAVDAPAIEISYRERGTSGGDTLRTLTTEPVRIEVTSVLAETDAFELGRIKGVVEPRSVWSMPVWVWAVAAALLVMALPALILLLRTRRQREHERLVRVSAHEVAMEPSKPRRWGM